MRINYYYVTKHFRQHADSEYVSYGGRPKRAEFKGKKKHSNTQLYILIQIIVLG